MLSKVRNLLILSRTRPNYCWLLITDWLIEFLGEAQEWKEAESACFAPWPLATCHVTDVLKSPSLLVKNLFGGHTLVPLFWVSAAVSSVFQSSGLRY